MKRFLGNIFITLLTTSFCAAQTKTDTTALDEVIVTATRTERKLGNVAVPVTIVSNKNIKQAASLRLNDILTEQTGVFINDAGFGSGVQMQGLDAAYTAVLLNGEPLIGRNTGVLDLKRLAVGIIEKIEIVRGPSSSLYGSEAMAGVINIITKQTATNKLSASMRYGSFQTFNANTTAYFKTPKSNYQFFVDAYHTNITTIRPYSVEKNILPVWKYNVQGLASTNFSSKTKFSLLARYSLEDFTTKFATTNLGVITYSDGFEKHSEYALNPTIIHKFNTKTKSFLRFYHTHYEARQDLNTSSTKEYYDYFRQRMYKVENQNDFSISKKINLTAGIGYIYENVRSSRYDNENNLKESKVGYAFLQTEIDCLKKLTTIIGLRYDNNSNYASAFAPKVSFSYKPSNKLHVTASVGYGFKAPDFRQLYLNFTNAAAGGYTVLGSLEATNTIAQLQQQGQIGLLYNNYSLLAALKPETSLGINIGGSYSFNNKTKIQLNLFRNSLENLIENAQVATYKSGAQIYSYININKAFTQGAELNISKKINQPFKIDLGYQLLFSGNIEEIDRIKKGLVYTKNNDGSARKMQLHEYIGLANRSRHSVNAKLLYEQKKFYANLRFIYHSRWAVADRNGNGVYDNNDEFANGYLLTNLTFGYQFNKHFGLQAGGNNLSNYTDINYLPTQMGRSFFLTINYN